MAVALISAGLSGTAARGEDASTAPGSVETLRPGTVFERWLARGAADVFHLPPARQTQVLTVEQRGVDVVVDLEADDGTHIVGVQSPSADRGLETVLIPPDWHASSAQGLTVRIAAASRAEPPGPYRIRIDPLTDEDTFRIDAETALHEVGRRFRLNGGGDAEAMAALVANAVDGFRAAGNAPREAAAHGLGAALASAQGRLDDALAHAGSHRALSDRTTSEGAPAEHAMGMHAWALAAEGGLRLRRGNLDAGERLLQAAYDAWQSVGDRHGMIDARAGLCLVEHRRGAFEQASRCYRDVLASARTLDDQALQAVMLGNLGGVQAALGEPERALEAHQQALALHRLNEHGQGEAQALNNLGALYRSLGEPDRAVASYRRALTLFEHAGDRYWQARTLNNLAFAHHSLGDPKRARVLFERALTLRREVGDPVGEAVTLSNLGQVHLALGDSRQALLAFRDSHRLRKASGNRRGEAAALQMIGTALITRGYPGLALGALDRALAMQSALGDQPRQTRVRLRRAEALLGLGQLAEAIAELNTAADDFDRLQDPVGATASLAALAQAAIQGGALDSAEQHLARARQRIESLRARIADPIQRATFLDAQRRVYALSIDLAFARHQREPSAGHDRRAFMLSESARARTLGELLAGRAVGHELSPTLRARLVSAQRQLSARSEQVRKQRAASSKKRRSGSADQALVAALGDLEAVWSALRARSPRLAALVDPPATTVEDVQRALTPDTLVLVYRLGDSRSFLWALTQTRFDTHVLPARREIEALARTTHRDLSQVDLRTGRSDSAARDLLADMILGPIAQRLDHRRVLVVADGALHYVPFAALRRPPSAPEPATAGDEHAPSEKHPPLLVHHEVAHLPAASLLRAHPAPDASGPERALTTSNAPAIAVLADPVFARSDPRVAAAMSTTEESTAEAADLLPGIEALPRLAHSRREAEAIAALAPGRVDLHLGFDARRDRVIDGAFGHYQVLHFATHGWIDTAHPELSALVLSRFDRTGAEQPGLLGLYDVYNLDLDAELVILSGCRTALGRALWGEGLIGLTRGFLYAGAQNVIASLWTVQDQATAALMVSLYRALLDDERRPADALRHAQQRMRADARWRDPAFWAPFVLLGPGS